jgi:hypothetical protein
VSRSQEPKWNVEELTDAQIYYAIRYLDGDLAQDSDSDSPLSKAETALFAICLLLIIVLVGYLGYFWLYRPQ